MQRTHGVAAVVLVAVLMVGGCSSAGTPTITGDTRTSAAPRAKPCTATDLSARLVAHGGEAEQTFSLLVLTNQGAAACAVDGYPSITAIGRTAADPTGVLATTIRHGTYFRPDPGPHEIVLAVGRSASCVLETELAHRDGAVDTITELRVTPPGVTGSTTIGVRLAATGPEGEPDPIDITALVAGSSGPPQ